MIKKVSLHSIKYTHEKFCNKNEPASLLQESSLRSPVDEGPTPDAIRFINEEVVPRTPLGEKPQSLTLRQKLEDKRTLTAQRLLAQCF